MPFHTMDCHHACRNHHGRENKRQADDLDDLAHASCHTIYTTAYDGRILGTQRPLPLIAAGGCLKGSPLCRSDPRAPVIMVSATVIFLSWCGGGSSVTDSSHMLHTHVASRERSPDSSRLPLRFCVIQSPSRPARLHLISHVITHTTVCNHRTHSAEDAHSCLPIQLSPMQLRSPGLPRELLEYPPFRFEMLEKLQRLRGGGCSAARHTHLAPLPHELLTVVRCPHCRAPLARGRFRAQPLYSSSRGSTYSSESPSVGAGLGLLASASAFCTPISHLSLILHWRKLPTTRMTPRDFGLGREVPASRIPAHSGQSLNSVPDSRAGALARPEERQHCAQSATDAYAARDRSSALLPNPDPPTLV